MSDSKSQSVTKIDTTTSQSEATVATTPTPTSTPASAPASAPMPAVPTQGTEIRIGVVGQVDNAKTTTIATLTNDGVLDDGNGSARKLLLAHPHEQDSGRTSSVTKGYLQLPSGNWMIFVDLAGHEKYLKTTLFGISGHEADYAMVVIGANMGVSRMTREHLSVVLSYQIPVYVVITKIDLVKDKPYIFEKTLADIQKLMMKTKRHKFTTVVENIDHVNQALDLMRREKIDYCPIFTISNKTGENLDLLKAFVHNLPPRYHFREQVASGRRLFRIHNCYTPKGVGLVLSGFMTEGEIKKNDTLFLGPIYGNWTKVTIRSIHDNFRTLISVLPQGQSGCLAIRLHDQRLELTKNRIRKGVCVADQMYNFTRRFKAKVKIMTSHSTTVRIHYQPIIHCKTIQQSAQICAIGTEETVMVPVKKSEVSEDGTVALKTSEDEPKSKETESDEQLVEKKVFRSRSILRAGDVSYVIFRFMFRGEFLNPGDLFLFREGNVRGIGRIEELLPDEDPGPRTTSRRRRGRRAFQEEDDQASASTQTVSSGKKSSQTTKA